MENNVNNSFSPHMAESFLTDFSLVPCPKIHLYSFLCREKAEDKYETIWECGAAAFTLHSVGIGAGDCLSDPVLFITVQRLSSTTAHNNTAPVVYLIIIIIMPFFRPLTLEI